MTHIPHFGAFESTKIHGSGTDILDTTRHAEFWREDLAMLRKAGVLDLRYPVPWHKIEVAEWIYDWAWMDGPMREMRDTGMRPVFDLIHHVSYPDWITGGMLDPRMPPAFSRFVREFMERYPWADRLTLFNEPIATSMLCTGAWPPYAHGRFLNVCEAVARIISYADVSARLTNPRYKHYYIDTCEHHRNLDPESQADSIGANHRRFLIADILMGRFDENHPLADEMRGVLYEEDREWYIQHPMSIDVLGLDYYPHSEMDWRNRQIVRPAERPLGFAKIAKQYADHFRRPIADGPLPLMLAETNIRGTVSDRLQWLKLMEREVDILSHTEYVVGFCWFPSIDSTDWHTLCTQATCTVDPQGIWWLGENREVRHESELSEWHARLASDSSEYSKIPDRPYGHPLDQDLAAYYRSH